MVQQKYLQLYKYQHPPIPFYNFNFMFKQMVAIQGHLNANSLIESSLPKYFSLMKIIFLIFREKSF